MKPASKNPAAAAAAPFSEPLLPQLDLPANPYYKPLHRNLRAAVRRYVSEELAPHAHEWEQAGQVPEAIRLRHCALGYAITHPIVDATDTGGVTLPGNVPYEEWDTWCSMIVSDEMSRMGYTGVSWGLGAGNGIGCPPISRFGSQEQKRKWLTRVARGELRFCLGITEPDGGSDVANIKTEARREGSEFVVNGAKKWITNGIWADYCTTAVRTGGQGQGGISLLVVPLNVKGVTRRRMENSGVNASGSTFITFEDVRVPCENLIGKENHGFGMIMSNFNPERLYLACASLRLARVCAQDAYLCACERETFGKPLIEHAPIRSKIASFGLLIEPVHAFLEQLVFIVETARCSGQDVNVGGMTALLKVMSTRCLEKVCREAQQILGDAAYTKSGKGVRIEQISRDVRVYVVGGGSEEIMLDLAVKQEARDVLLRAKRQRNAKL